MARLHFKELSRSHHVTLTEQWLQPLIHARDVLIVQSKFTGLLPAQLDFHLLFPVLFESAGKGSKDAFPDAREWLPPVLDHQKDIRFRFFITGPTFLEFLDQLQHQSEACRDVITKMIGRFDKGLDPLDEHAFATSEKLRTWLEMLTTKDFETAVMKPVRAFEAMLTSGRIQGAGDLEFTPQPELLARYRIICDDLYDRQAARRLRHDSQKRREVDSRFHYKVDAANVCLSLMMQEETHQNLYLFTRTQYAYRAAKDLARSDRALPALYNLLTLETTPEDRIAFLEDTIRYGSRNRQLLEDYNTVADFPRFLVRRLEEFALKRVPTLSAPSDMAPQARDQQTVEEIREVLGNRKKLSDRMERAVDQIRKGGQHIVEVAADKVDIDLWEDFDLSDDPVYQKIRREFF